MEPEIQYTRSADNASLAYWMIGEGPPFVIAATYPWSHIQLEWRIPEIRHFYETLARHRTLIRYDGRGGGLSEKNVTDFSLDLLVADLTAVVDRLRLDTFDLMGIIAAGPIAIKYAAQNPSRVSNLILWSTYARAADYMRGPQVQATRALIEKDWELYTEAVAHTLLGWSAGEPARRYAALIRSSVTPESARAFMAASGKFDATEWLPHITAPTLVMHRREVAWVDLEASKHLASNIADARLRNLEGESILPFLGDMDSLAAEIDTFTGHAAAKPRERSAASEHTEWISHYKILKKIASGGMGELYLARDMTLDRSVALKVLAGHIAADRDRLHRFIQEAKAASSLNHPNVCVVHEIGGVESGKPYIVMEYLDGETVAAKVERGRLAISEILDVCGQVLEGLSEAHSKGIVHRDIKSSNVMVTARGLAKILDFGVAQITPDEISRSQAATVKLTTTGMLIGTVQYMSPEQTLGRHVDHRTDIFSFGVLLYEMSAGKPPFSGESPLELMENIRHQRAKSILENNPELPLEFQRVAAKCMEKDPEHRYQSAARVLEDWSKIGREIRKRSQKRKALLAGAVVLIALIALIALIGIRQPPPAPPSTKAIVVTPFLNLSGDPDTDYLNDGITEELINALTKVSGLHVVPRTTAFALKGKNLDVKQIRDMLKVDTVLEGSLRKAGNRLRVTAQLVNASTGDHIWSNTYDGNIEDIFHIQDEIPNMIAHALSATLSPADSASTSKRSPTNIDAYQRYLQGRYLWNKRTPPDLMKAIEYFKDTTRLDPNYAPAYVGIADSFGLLASQEYGVMKPADSMSQARSAAMKALQIDDTLAEAHVSLGNVYYQFDWNWPAAEKEFRRAIQLNPAYPTGHHWYAEFLEAMGRFDEAIREVETAKMLDPLSLIIATAHGRALYFARRYDASIEKYQDAIRLEPDFPLAHAGLGYAYAQKSMNDAAVAEFTKAIQITGRIPVLLGSLGYAYGVSGNKPGALELLQELNLIGKQMYVLPGYKAAIHIGLNDKKAALAAIEEAFREKSGFVVFLGVEPAADGLRSDPRFKDVLTSVGLPVK